MNDGGRDIENAKTMQIRARKLESEYANRKKCVKKHKKLRERRFWEDG